MNKREAILIHERSVIDGLLQDVATDEHKDLAATSTASSQRIFTARLDALKQRDTKQKKTPQAKR